MVELVIAAVIVSSIITPYVLLRAKSAKKKRIDYEKGRPVQERIDEIREYAKSMQSELPTTRDNLRARYPNKEIAWSWIDPVIDYCRRLEKLADSSGASTQDAIELAEESLLFVKDQKIKGVFVAEFAQKLAELIEDRNSESNDNH